MKTIKTLLTLSALASVSGAAHATIWNIQMNANTAFGSNGTVEMTGFTGTWDDVNNIGSWSGTTKLPLFNATVNYTQTFTMNEQTGKGNLNAYDLSSCTDDQSGILCQSLQTVFQGTIKNTAVNPANPNDYKNELPFNPQDGWTGQWTLQIFKFTENEDGSTELNYIPLPMNVTPHALPVPAAAWLFGSGVIGLAGAARRRRSV